MAHVQIGNLGGLTIDGVRVEAHADDLIVDFSTVPPTVRCTIPADTLDVDLPDAVLQVFRDRNPEPSLRDEVRAVRERLEDIVHAFDPLATSVGAAINGAAAKGHRDRKRGA